MAGMMDVATGPILMNGFADSFFGQSEASPFTAPPSLGAMLQKLLNKASQMAAVGNAFDAARMPGQLQTQLSAEAMYDPNIAGLRRDTTSGFQNQLDLAQATTLPPDMLASILQAGFQRGALTGVGGGAGRNLTALDIAQTWEERLNNALNGAANWSRSSPGLNELFQPNQDITPAFGASYDAARLNANNAYQQYLTQVKNQNTMNLIDRPLGIAQNVAGIVGAFYGIGNKGGGAPGAGGAASSASSAGGASMPNQSFSSYYGRPLTLSGQ